MSSSITINELPDEILQDILSRLSVQDMARAANVSRRWAWVLQEPRVWRRKRYEHIGPVRPSETLPVARVWPTLISLNLVKRDRFRIDLNISGATLELPDLTDNDIHSIVAALVTKSLVIDVDLLDERLENCLVVKTDTLHRLSVNIPPGPLDKETLKATDTSLRALARTFSTGTVSALRSLRISSKCVTETEYDSCAAGKVLLALRACPKLKQLRVSGCTCVSWRMVGGLNELKVLSVVHSKIEEFAVRERCQELKEVTLEHCPFLRRLQFWDMQHILNLHTLHISNASVSSEALEDVCRIAPVLQVLTLQSCSNITYTSFVRHCTKLKEFELGNWWPEESSHYSGLLLLPVDLQNLSLMETTVGSHHLESIVQRLPYLETLNLSGCMSVLSVSFLRHCTKLVDLNLAGLRRVPPRSFSVLRQLRKLQTLNVRSCAIYNDLLTTVVQAMPELTKLDLSNVQTVTDLSFLRKCHGLRCLNLSYCFRISSDFTELRSFSDVTLLRIYGIPGRPFITDLGREWK